MQVSELAGRRGSKPYVVDRDAQDEGCASRKAAGYGERIMNTDDLVEVLSARVDPADFRTVGRRIAMAVAPGSVLAVAARLVGFRPRTGLSTLGSRSFFVLE